jgi:hypothetical protein
MSPPHPGKKVIKHSYNSHKRKNNVTKSLNASRNPRESKLSHSQLFSLLLMLEPSDDNFRDFISIANSFRPSPGQPFPATPPLRLVGLHNCRQWEDKVISKTPIWLLDYALSKIGDRDYLIERYDLSQLGLASDHAYLLEGTLNHHAVPELRQLSPHNCHQPLEEYVYLHQHSHSNADRSAPPPTVILYIPSCNVFFSVFAPMTSHTISGTNTNTGLNRPMWAPLPSSWLRIQRADGQVSNGGYLSHIRKAYRIAPRMSLIVGTYRQGHHLPDESIRIPPDYISDCALSRIYPSDLSGRRKVYHDLLLKSSTQRALCKRTVNGLLYKSITSPSNLFNISVSDIPLDKEYNLRIVSHEDLSKVHRESTLRIRRLDMTKHHMFEKHALHLQRSLSRNKSGAVRKNPHSFGSMFAVGKHVHNGEICLYQRTRQLGIPLRHFMIQYRRLLDMHFPLELACMVAQMEAFGESPPYEMGDKDGVVPSANISLDLGNEPHYDTNDLGVGVSVWLEDNPGKASNWKFVIPNVCVKHDNITYEGLVVDLCHGAFIQWDGGSIRHCTSVTDLGAPSNHVYGFHLTNNFPSLKQYEEIRRRGRQSS